MNIPIEMVLHCIIRKQPSKEAPYILYHFLTVDMESGVVYSKGHEKRQRSRLKNMCVVYRSPTTEEYISLRKAVGWNIPDEQAINISLKNALFSVCLEKKDKIIGCGRVIGDEGLYFYIQDIIVLPEYQGHGYGKKIMDEIMHYIHHKTRKGAFIGLFAAKGMEGLYKKYGFIKRPDENSGAGMFLVKKEIGKI